MITPNYWNEKIEKQCGIPLDNIFINTEDENSHYFVLQNI